MNLQEKFSADSEICETPFTLSETLVGQPAGVSTNDEFKRMHTGKSPFSTPNPKRGGDSHGTSLMNDLHCQTAAHKNSAENDWRVNSLYLTPYNEIYNMAVISDFP